MRYLKWVIGAIIGAYLLLALALFYFQDTFLFHPEPRPASYSYGDYPDASVALDDGTILDAIIIPAYANRPGEGVILYLHGNRGDNGRSLHQTHSLTGLGYDLFLVDYRGFGKSTGEITSDEELTEDLQAVYDRLVERYGEENTIVVGYSLGTGPASFLAARNEPRGTVLVAPFTSLIDMKNEFFGFFPDFLLSYTMDNEARLASATTPVTIVHGRDDPLIPIAMGRELSAINPGLIRLVELPGITHRGAIFSPAVRGAVVDFVAEGSE